MAYASFSDLTSNIVCITFHGDQLSPEGFDQYLVDLEALYATRSNLIVIFDGTKTSHLPVGYRQKMGHWMADHKRLVQKSCMLQIFVISSPLMRFVLQGIFLIQKPPVSFKTISNLADATKLAEEILSLMQEAPVELNS